MKALHTLTFFLPLIAANAQASGPAYFTVHDLDDGKDLTFVVRIDNPAVIDQARALLSLPLSERLPVQGIVVKAPVSYNAPWGFHFDPDSISFFETNIEVCDASAQEVENHLAEIGASFLPGNHWCPWNSALLAEVPAPADAATSLRMASAASNSEAAISPGALVSLYGSGLTDRTEQGDASQWPLTLAGVSLEIQSTNDGAIYTRPLQLLVASPTQVNALIPADVPLGPVSISLKNTSGATFRTASWVEAVAPALFAVSQNNIEYAAASLLRVHADGTSSGESLIGADPATGQLVPLPLNPGSPSDRLYLSLYGTGFTNLDAQAVGLFSITHSDDGLPIVYAGPQGQTAGLDQVNIEITALTNDRPFVDLALFANTHTQFPVRTNRVRILIGGAGNSTARAH
jgi:uncharacterized protein (TIGR03437 family)